MINAPIALFTFNRPWHAFQTVEALQKNELAAESDLFIFSDGARSEADRGKVQAVRKQLSAITGFNKVTVIERSVNLGLARSIISGVTEIINKHGRIIVLEDDMLTSPYFLRFMNDALEFYKNEPRVMHISGWNYPINTEGLKETLLWRGMNCWGWGTWDRAWKYFEKDTDKLCDTFSKEDIFIFDLDGHMDNWDQVMGNKHNNMDTWAVYWYASIFSNNGLCLNPRISFVQNIGLDRSGIHCGESEHFSHAELAADRIDYFENSIEENDVFMKRVKSFYKNHKISTYKSALNRLKKLFSSTC